MCAALVELNQTPQALEIVMTGVELEADAHNGAEEPGARGPATSQFFTIPIRLCEKLQESQQRRQ